MNKLHPITLEGHGIRLEPGQTGEYIANALAGQEAGHMLPWAVRER
jgi:hypothetical protein